MFTFDPPRVSYAPFMNPLKRVSPFAQSQRILRKKKRRISHQRSKSSSDANLFEELSLGKSSDVNLKSVLHHPDPIQSTKKSFSPPTLADKLHDNVKKYSKKSKKHILQQVLNAKHKKETELKRIEVEQTPLVFRKQAVPSPYASKGRYLSFSRMLFPNGGGASYFIRPKKYYVFVPQYGDRQDHRVHVQLYDSSTGYELMEKALQKYRIERKQEPRYSDPRLFKLFIGEADGTIDDDFPSLNPRHYVNSYRCKFFVMRVNRRYVERSRCPFFRNVGEESTGNDSDWIKNKVLVDDVRLKIFIHNNLERFHFVVIPPDLLVRDLVKVVCKRCNLPSEMYHLQMIQEKKKVEIPLELRYKTVGYAGLDELVLTKKFVHGGTQGHIYSRLQARRGVRFESGENDDDEKVSDNVKNLEGVINTTNNTELEGKTEEKQLMNEFLRQEEEIEHFPYREYKVVKYSMFYIKQILILGFDGKTLCCKYPKFKKRRPLWLMGGGGTEDIVADSEIEKTKGVEMEKQIEKRLSNLKRVVTFKDKSPKKFEIVFMNDESFTFEAKTKVEVNEIVERLRFLLKFYEQERNLSAFFSKRRQHDHPAFLLRMEENQVSTSF